MDLWIQPCARCADLYGKSAAEHPHQDLTLNGAGAVKDARAEEHYTCVRCHAVFARILVGPPARQIWMLLNAGQH
jgi:cytochrome c551/c552